jgi:hypothetical protein
MKTQLEIGDIIYLENWYSGISKLIVDKVTPTLAISGNSKFKRQLGGDNVIPFPKPTGFHRDIYRLPDGNIEIRFEEQQIKRLIDRELKNLTLDQLRKIKDIIK